jgi:CheY-like chemotaxis protein
MANDGACKHVLVIDDDEDHADLLALLLRTEKPCRFTTDVAFDGRQGVSMADRHWPAAAVIDLQMPGWTGFETGLAQSTVPGRASPVLIAMSGSKEALERAKAEGMFNHAMSKPLDIDRLLGFLDHA